MWTGEVTARTSPQTISTTPRHRWARLNTWVVGIALTWAIVTVTMHAREVIAQGGDPWQQGDWLINYAAGPVRRGLIGSVIFLFAPEQALVWAVLIGLMALALVLAGFWWLFLGTSRSPLWTMLVLSPAVALFPAMYPTASLRKELIALAALALAGVALRYGWASWLMVVSAAVFSLAALAHEASIVVLPGLLYIFWVSHRQGGLSRTWLVILQSSAALSVVVAALMSATMRGTADQIAGICSSWVAHGLSEGLCNGALTAVGASTVDSVRFVSEQFPGYFNYLLPLALAVIPIAVLRPCRGLWWTAGATAIVLVPVLTLGIDWGRWFALAVTALTIVVLSTWTRCACRPLPVPEWVAVVYVLLWSMPFNEDMGQASLAARWLTNGWSAVHQLLA